jgi:hypothetical protein
MTEDRGEVKVTVLGQTGIFMNNRFFRRGKTIKIKLKETVPESDIRYLQFKVGGGSKDGQGGCNIWVGLCSSDEDNKSSPSPRISKFTHSRDNSCTTGVSDFLKEGMETELSELESDGVLLLSSWKSDSSNKSSDLSDLEDHDDVKQEAEVDEVVEDECDQNTSPLGKRRSIANSSSSELSSLSEESDVESRSLSLRKKPKRSRSAEASSTLNQACCDYLEKTSVDLVGHLAVAIVYHGSATITESDLIRNVLHAQVGMVECLANDETSVDGVVTVDEAIGIWRPIFLKELRKDGGCFGRIERDRLKVSYRFSDSLSWLLIVIVQRIPQANLSSHLIITYPTKIRIVNDARTYHHSSKL